MPKALLCPPDYFDVVDQKNPYMTPGGKAVDRGKARKQWEALCCALQECGCEIEIIKPVLGLEGMVYITPGVTPRLEAILTREGLKPVIVAASEFEKAGGSCFCMKMFLP